MTADARFALLLRAAAIEAPKLANTTTSHVGLMAVLAYEIAAANTDNDDDR